MVYLSGVAAMADRIIKSNQTRETRDLMGWEQFDSFMRGDAEPSCDDLRRMWQLAKKLHNANTAAAASRRRHGAAASSVKTRDIKEENEDAAVYGIVRTHVTTTTPRPPPRRPFRVRDPAKEILNLIRQRNALRRRQRLRQQKAQLVTSYHPEQAHYGQVRYEAPSSQPQESSSYLNQLKTKLYGGQKEEEEGESYGVVHTAAVAPPRRSPFDRLRDMVAQERAGSATPRPPNGHAFQQLKAELQRHHHKHHRQHSSRPRLSQMAAAASTKSFRSSSDSKRRRKHVSVHTKCYLLTL